MILRYKFEYFMRRSPALSSQLFTRNNPSLEINTIIMVADPLR